jgi:hypothetical protein
MLGSVAAGATDRALRLFACACTRLMWGLLPGGAERGAVEVAERHADGLADGRELEAARAGVSRARGAGEEVRLLARAAAHPGPGSGAEIAAKTAVRAGGAEARCRLLRCIFGNPFRPVPFDQTWRTPAVSSLAQAAYEERVLPSAELEPARLAVLADALEEAGCTEAAVLDHLRGPGPHVRGCWAVDLVLARR